MALSEIANQDESIKKYFGPLFSDAVVTRIESMLEKNEGDHALLMLAQLDWSKRTPKIHQLTSQAIQKLSLTSAEIFQQPIVKDYLQFICGKDPEVREQLIKYLESAIFLNRASVEINDQYFVVLSLVRPDPNPLNDQIRISMMKSLLSMGNYQTSSHYEASLTSIGVLDKIRLSIAQLRGVSILKAFIPIIVLLVVLLVPYLFLRNRKVKEGGSSSEVYYSEDVDEDRRVFVTARGGNLDNGGYPYEYVSAMHDLGLPAEASLKEIKTAFRNKMKGIHPDKLEKNAGVSEEFIHIKEVYEKILILRKDLGLDV